MASATVFREEETEIREGLDDVPRRINRSSLLWLDVERTPRELEHVAELLELEESTIQRLSDGTGAPALDDRRSYTHTTTCIPRREVDGSELDAVDCIVGERWVVTVHDRPIAVLDEFRERAQGSGPIGRLDGPAFLAGLLEWVLGEYARAFDQIEADLEELDVSALRAPLDDPEAELRRLVGLRRDVGSLQRSLAAHREPLTALTHPELDALASESSARLFGAVIDRFDVTVQAGRDARTSIVSSFDVLMARTEHRTNEILKVLTVASVLFLPGALIAGILGMNFKVSLFEHPGLFWVALAVILAIILGTLAAARVRRWI